MPGARENHFQNHFPNYSTTLLLSEDAICYWVKSFRMREAVKIKTLWPVVNTFVPAVGLLYENVNNNYS